MNRHLPDPVEEPTITVARAAAILGVGKSTLYAVVARGECPSIPANQRIVRIPTARFLAHYGLTGEAGVNDTKQA